jgi:hypothetical protein
MEAVSLFLLLLLPPTDTTGDIAESIQASLRSQLGNVAMAIAPDTLVTPAMWQGPKAPMHAHFVARVVWTAKDKARVELLATKTAMTPSASRELTFASQDRKIERGRAIGLVLAELLRESPASAFADGVALAAAPEIVPHQPPRMSFGGIFETERVMSGQWAVGPELINSFALYQGLQLQVRGMALFAARQYSDLGFGLSLRWDFLRGDRGRRSIGIGLGGDVFRESVAAGDSDHGATSKWNGALVTSLTGRVAIWSWLRLIGEVDLRAVSGGLTFMTGDDANRHTYSFSQWRPGFAAGIEVTM